MVFSRKVFLVGRLRVPYAQAQMRDGNLNIHSLAIAALILFGGFVSEKGMAEVGSCYRDSGGSLVNECSPGYQCPASVPFTTSAGCIASSTPTTPTPTTPTNPTPNPGGGGACVPARRERSCLLPANAVSSTSYSFYDCNARRWSNYSACETICNAGFNLVGNSCVPIPKPTCSLQVFSGLEGLTLPQKGGELKVRVSNLQGATIVGQPTPGGAIRNNNEFTWTIPENTGTIGINHKFEVTVSKNGVTGTCSRTLSQTPKCVFSNYNVRDNFPASGGAWLLDMSTNVGEVRIESSAFGNSFDAYTTLQSNKPFKKVFNFRLGATNRTENFPFTFVALANNGGECGRWPANQVPAPPSCTLNIIGGLEGSVIPQAGGQLRFRVSNVSSGAEITRIPNGATSSGNDFTLNISQNSASTAINHNFEVVVSRNGVNGTCSKTVEQTQKCNVGLINPSNAFVPLPLSVPSTQPTIRIWTNQNTTSVPGFIERSCPTRVPNTKCFFRTISVNSGPTQVIPVVAQLESGAACYRGVLYQRNPCATNNYNTLATCLAANNNPRTCYWRFLTGVQACKNKPQTAASTCQLVEHRLRKELSLLEYSVRGDIGTDDLSKLIPLSDVEIDNKKFIPPYFNSAQWPNVILLRKLLGGANHLNSLYRSFFADFWTKYNSCNQSMDFTRCEIVAFHTDDPSEKALARQAAESVYTEEECQALQGPHKVSTVWRELVSAPARSLLNRSDIDNQRATWSDSPHLLGD